MTDSGTVSLDIARTVAKSPAHAISRLEHVLVQPQRKACVVVNQRTGTIVIGADMRISRAAIFQGNLTIHIQEEPLVARPKPFSQDESGVITRTTVDPEEEEGVGLAELRSGTSLSEVVACLNALGFAPRDMIDILKSIKAAGALHAEFALR